MATVLGVDGCKAGWIAAEVSPEHLRWLLFHDAAALLTHPGEVIAVDCPLGLTRAGPRPCDVQARRRLTGQASSVFPAPVRAALDAESYAEARALSVSASGVSLSAQTWGIVPKIRDLDRHRDPRLLEVHPELSFRELTGAVLDRKKTAAGALQRMTALTGHFGSLPGSPPAGAGLDDCLDALACAWTAQRWLLGTAVALGGEVDETGQVMRIVV